MAWLELESSGFYHIAFRFGDQKFKKSLKTKDQQRAEARRVRLEENIRLVESGRLTIPDDADPCSFLLSDGKLNGKAKLPKSLMLCDLFSGYRDTLPKDAMELGSLRIAGVHMRHFVRILGGRRAVRTITTSDLQEYVTTRSREPGKRGKFVSAGTIKKELSTFSALWTWAGKRGYVSGPFPKDGLKYPKLDEKPPFQTWEQIGRQIESGGLSEAEQADLWDCLFLSGDDLQELLDHIQKTSRYDFLYPMSVMAAHTGARRSEICRSRVADFDLEGGTVLIRERKRAKGRRTTRMVTLTQMLLDVITRWFDEKPRSMFTFPEDHQVARVRKSRAEEDCVTPDEASHHLELCLASSKWAKIRGWHIFRHSFISICAAKSVDQRMIDAWVGHTTEEMRRRYRHLYPNVEREALQSVFG